MVCDALMGNQILNVAMHSTCGDGGSVLQDEKGLCCVMTFERLGFDIKRNLNKCLSNGNDHELFW